jgi:hypothetical protein
MSGQCITDEVFAEYIECRISEKKRGHIEKHLSECNFCLNLFDTVDSNLKDPELLSCEPVSESFAKSMMQKVLNRRSKSPSVKNHIVKTFYTITDCINEIWQTILLPQPQLARIRSSQSQTINCIKFEKQLNDFFKIEMLIERKSTEKVSIDARFIETEKLKNSSILLLKEGGGPISFPMEDDKVTIESIPFGKYELLINQGTAQKAFLLFEINKDGFYEL